jgi:hypothetical protein
LPDYKSAGYIHLHAKILQEANDKKEEEDEAEDGYQSKSGEEILAINDQLTDDNIETRV